MTPWNRSASALRAGALVRFGTSAGRVMRVYDVVETDHGRVYLLSYPDARAVSANRVTVVPVLR